MARTPARESRVRSIATLDLASLVAGIFTAAAEILKERHDTYIQSCAAAAQTITDDAFDVDTGPVARKATVAAADGKLRQCWEK